VAANSSPTIDAADAAVYRRLLVLPFETQVGTEGSTIPSTDALQKIGLDAFMQTDVGCRMVWLSWLLEGYAGYVREGIDNPPKAVLTKTAIFQIGLNDLNTFLNSQIIGGPKALGSCIPFSYLYNVYETWCFENRIKEKDRLSRVAFSRKLKANGLEIERRWCKPGDLDYDKKRPQKGGYIMHTRFITPDDSEVQAYDDAMEAFSDLKPGLKGKRQQDVFTVRYEE
jgi:phage/plasmid-associated DNA primase